MRQALELPHLFYISALLLPVFWLSLHRLCSVLCRLYVWCVCCVVCVWVIHSGLILISIHCTQDAGDGGSQLHTRTTLKTRWYFRFIFFFASVTPSPSPTRVEGGSKCHRFFSPFSLSFDLSQKIFPFISEVFLPFTFILSLSPFLVFHFSISLFHLSSLKDFSFPCFSLFLLYFFFFTRFSFFLFRSVLISQDWTCNSILKLIKRAPKTATSGVLCVCC